MQCFKYEIWWKIIKYGANSDGAKQYVGSHRAAAASYDH